jgi:hypothetical protein
MTSAASTYPGWKAPAEDGQILLWPDAAQLAADAVDNHRRLSSASQVLIQNIPLPELRRRQREWVNHDDQQVLIADGHQTELHHAGVWVKRIATHFAASRLGGSAAHFAVDTDAPKHLTLRWLGGAEPITDDPNISTAQWCGLLDAPTPRHLEHLQQRLRDADLADSPVADDFLGSLRRLSLEQPKLSPAVTNAMHELDWGLGLRHHALLASPVWMSEPFLVFAHHVIARAGEFAADYNGALARYRREKKVRTPTRPMPDLAVLDESIELPFWLDNLQTGTRLRPSAFLRDGKHVLVCCGGEELEFDPRANGWDAAGELAQWLRRNELRLSPRALTLTMFLRLAVVDQFIHGIGGGQYDQVTDAIIADHFKLAPPRFSVATATMYLPEAVGRSRACVACIAQEGHHLRHSLLGPRKHELVEQINAAPRGSSQRYVTFAQMHRELESAVLNHPEIRDWQQKFAEAREREAEESAIFDRELFYALQPRDRLADMIERFRDVFAA